MRKSRLSQHKQNKIIELFVAGITAQAAAELVNVNKTTVAYCFHRLRLLIYQNARIWRCLKVKLKQMKAILAVPTKVNEVELWVKPLYLGF